MIDLVVNAANFDDCSLGQLPLETDRRVDVDGPLYTHSATG